MALSRLRVTFPTHCQLRHPAQKKSSRVPRHPWPPRRSHAGHLDTNVMLTYAMRIKHDHGRRPAREPQNLLAAYPRGFPGDPHLQ